VRSTSARERDVVESFRRRPLPRNEFTSRRSAIVSLSVDDQDTARQLIAKHGLTFPVGHSADAAAIHEATGAFVNADPVHLQSTGFVRDPDGNVVISVYSSGAIDRLVPEDVAGWSTTSGPSGPHDYDRDDSRRALVPHRATARDALVLDGEELVVATWGDRRLTTSHLPATGYQVATTDPLL
jgi:hypothetical protein